MKMFKKYFKYKLEFNFGAHLIIQGELLFSLLFR